MNNTSLSARIKRRNAQNFEGIGTSSGWKKTTFYGTYEKEKGIVDSNKHILIQSKKLGLVGKHGGSKPISRLITMLKSWFKFIEKTNKVNKA